ncbi:MAG: hypothetical protein LBV00_12695 [Propionibacteriaceae bacterium]|jgi:hypothetical protein|nr:hypothetical protein [Propionibacteriaceae bacterium]
MTARLRWCVVIWAICVALGLFHVLDLPHTCLVAAGLTAVIVIWPTVWPTVTQLPELPIETHLGGRSDLSELAWRAFGRPGRASTKAMARLRALTDESEALEPLRRQIDANSAPTPAEVLHWLDLIDATNLSVDSTTPRPATVSGEK